MCVDGCIYALRERLRWIIKKQYAGLDIRKILYLAHQACVEKANYVDKVFSCSLSTSHCMSI